jgi:hypothetical protein
MTVVTVRPDGYVSETNISYSVTGSTQYGRVNDEDDNTYAATTSSNGRLRLTLGNPSPAIPAGAIVKALATRIRLRRNSGSNSTDMAVRLYSTAGVAGSGTVNFNWSTYSTVTGFTANTSAYTASDLNSFDIEFERTGTYDGTSLHVSALYADFTYVTKPVVTVSQPTGTITNTNRPLTQWANSLDSDGGSQTKYEVKIFSSAQYTAGGFDPATSLPVVTSGEVSSSSLSYQIPGVLSNDSYRAYIRVAQTVNANSHRSDWAYSAFTLNYTEPAVEDGQSYTAQVVSPVFRRASIKPLALDFSWSDGATFLPWTINGNQYPPTVQKDGVSRPGTDANYAVVAASNNIAMTFTATAAMPAGTLIREYKWDWGDGQVGYGPVAVHEYKIASPETRVSLTITDSNGNSWSRSKLLNLKYADRSVVRVYEVRNP